jgi:HAD superfamily phosphoserine phosphatase-like hydrolase
MKFKVLFFDCDGVLIKVNPWASLHLALGFSDKRFRAWRKKYYSRKTTFGQWIKRFETFYLKKNLSLAFFKKFIGRPKINGDVYPILRYLKTKKIKVAIISSSIDYCVRLVAKKLGVKLWRTNYNFVFGKDGKFQKIDYVDTEERAKMIQIKEICRKLKIKPTQTIFVGDSRNDADAFKLTKHGVMYQSQDKTLKRVAWKRIKNLLEIKNFC